MVNVCHQLRKRPEYASIKVQLERLALLLQFYQPISIDSFLFHFPNDPDLISTAKKVITHILLYAHETQDEAFVNKNLEGWYRFLWDAIVSGRTAEELADPSVPLNLTIVTFNYDSSLEFYLHSRAKVPLSLFNKEQQQGFLDKLAKSIHHVYGCILNYTWCGGRDNNQILCSDDDEDVYNLIEQCHSRIRLINERSSSAYDKIKAAVWASQQLIFLGFGFDDTNIGPKVLDLKNLIVPSVVGDNDTLPLVKYTNFGDSEIINRKLRNIILSHVQYPAQLDYHLFKSTKTVYRAVSEDFSLTGLH